MTNDEIQLAMAINALMRIALKQTNGNERVAAARLFTIGVEWSLSMGIDELKLSDRLFSIARDHEEVTQQ